MCTSIFLGSFLAVWAKFEVQSSYFRGSPAFAFGSVAENNHSESLDLVGACPRFACASSKWTAWGSDCATIKLTFYNPIGHFQVLK